MFDSRLESRVGCLLDALLGSSHVWCILCSSSQMMAVMQITDSRRPATDLSVQRRFQFPILDLRKGNNSADERRSGPTAPVLRPTRSPTYIPLPANFSGKARTHRFGSARITTPARSTRSKWSTRFPATTDPECSARSKSSITVRDIEISFNWLSSSRRRISASSIGCLTDWLLTSFFDRQVLFDIRESERRTTSSAHSEARALHRKRGQPYSSWYR